MIRLTASEILAFERDWWKFQGSKEEAIRSKFGVTITRYYQRLNTILDSEDALAADPLTVNRLRRIRAPKR